MRIFYRFSLDLTFSKYRSVNSQNLPRINEFLKHDAKSFQVYANQKTLSVNKVDTADIVMFSSFWLFGVLGRNVLLTKGYPIRRSSIVVFWLYYTFWISHLLGKRLDIVPDSLQCGIGKVMTIIPFRQFFKQLKFQSIIGREDILHKIRFGLYDWRSLLTKIALFLYVLYDFLSYACTRVRITA